MLKFDKVSKVLNKKYKIWGLFFGLLLSSTLPAQEVSVRAQMDSVMMLIGHQTKLTLEMTKPADVDIAFPLVLDTLIDKVEVLSRTEIDTALLEGSREHLIQEFIVTSFDSGYYFIPPFEFEIQNGGGTLQTNPLILKMYTYQIDSIAGIFDIKPIKKVKLQFREVLPYILGFLILTLLVAIGYILYRRIKKKEPIFIGKPKPKEPPYITAFRELERIRTEKLWQKGKEKQYFTELTDTLREYLEGRFDIATMERTSDEILNDLKEMISKIHFQKLEAMLQLSDLVKFAKLKPLMDESERCIKDVYVFVDETKFIPEEKEVEEEDSPINLPKEDLKEQEKEVGSNRNENINDN